MAARKKSKRKAKTKIIDEIFEGFSERSDPGRRANQRGKGYERAIANALKRVFPRARRLFGQTREGYEVPDVGGTPFWVECSDGATSAIHDKLRQGLEATKLSPNEEYGGAPVVVFSHHQRSGQHMATVTRDDFIKLLTMTGVVRDRERVEKRFWPKVDKNGPIHAALGSRCWDWTAAKTDGYGQIWIDQIMVYAHRVSYELANGPIGDGKLVLHRCDRRQCCNPAHLYAGSVRDNMRDRKERGGYAAGEKHIRAKITDEQVKEIRCLRDEGFDRRTIAKKFGISVTQVSRICRGISR